MAVDALLEENPNPDPDPKVPLLLKGLEPKALRLDCALPPPKPPNPEEAGCDTPNGVLLPKAPPPDDCPPNGDEAAEAGVEKAPVPNPEDALGAAADAPPKKED